MRALRAPTTPNGRRLPREARALERELGAAPRTVGQLSAEPSGGTHRPQQDRRRRRPAARVSRAAIRLALKRRTFKRPEKQTLITDFLALKPAGLPAPRPPLTVPKTAAVALYIIRVPSVVTSRDCAIIIFSPQQNRIQTATAAELVALRCNGDGAGDLRAGAWKTSFCYRSGFSALFRVYNTYRGGKGPPTGAGTVDPRALCATDRRNFFIWRENVFFLQRITGFCRTTLLKKVFSDIRRNEQPTE
jgi:hypothetical protein